MDSKPQDRKEDARPQAAVPLLVIEEQALSRVSAHENLLSGEDSAGDVEMELELTIDVAASEIAQALVQTGRSLRYLHLLRVSLDERAWRRGYLEGARAMGTICNALARDPDAAERGGEAKLPATP